MKRREILLAVNEEKTGHGLFENKTRTDGISNQKAQFGLKTAGPT